MYNKNYIKIIFFIITIILIIISILFIKRYNNKNLIEENIKYKINYFIEYSQDGNVGVIDRSGNEIIEPKYVDIYIPNPEKDVFICITDDENYVVINSKKEELLKEYNNVSAFITSEGMLDFEKEVLRYEENGKYGVIDFDGNIILKPEYDTIESLKFKPGKLLIKKDNKYGVIDNKGNIVVDIKYDSIIGDGFCLENDGYTKTGYIVKLKINDGYMSGYIDVEGKEFLKPEYENIERILNYTDKNNVYLIVMKNGKKGIYKNSKQIIKHLYQKISYSESSNILVAKTSKNNIFYNLDGKKILDGKYDEYSLAGNYISVLDGETQKLYDVNGNFITNQSYKRIEETANSNYIITIDENNYYSIMNKSTIIKDNYINLKYAFGDYFIFTTENNKVGILDVWNGIIINPEYDSILKLENINAFEAKNGNETTIYSQDLDKISTISDAIVENIENNYAIVYSQNERIYLNKEGKEISNIEILKNRNLFSVKENDKWGFKDKDGNIKVECIYDIVTEINEYGFAGIKKDGKWGVINDKGSIIVEPQYEIETYYFPEFIGDTYLEQTDTIHCIKLR